MTDNTLEFTAFPSHVSAPVGRRVWKNVESKRFRGRKEEKMENGQERRVKRTVERTVMIQSLYRAATSLFGYDFAYLL